MDKLPNLLRNKAVEDAIPKVNEASRNSETTMNGVANALATLDMAESTQILAVKIEESFAKNERAIGNAFDALIQSNENVARSNGKYSDSMRYLTLGLIAVGLLQVFVPIVMFFMSQPVIGIK